MKELLSTEIDSVYGAGIITDTLTNLGGTLLDRGYQLLFPSLNVTLPILGTINIGTLLPDFGQNVGRELGGLLGNTIETGLAKIPVIGGSISKILGN